MPRIAEELARDHVVRSSLAFNVYVRFNGDSSFQAGTYDLRQNLGAKGAVAALKKGPRIDYVLLTVPPGLWLKQIATRVGRLGGGRSAQVFLADTSNNAVRSVFEPQGVSNLEGLLRPDTYKISESEDEIGILQTMVTAFDTTRREARPHQRERARAHAVPDHHRRVDDRGRGEGAAGPSAHRVGDLQPARAAT